MKITCIILTRTPEISLEKFQEMFEEVILFVDGQGKNESNKNTKIIFHKLNRDFAAQRNLALSHAAYDWVVFIDDDESVSVELAQEMHKILPEKYAGYRIKREDVFMGRKLQQGETGNISLLRFARKDAGSWKRPVHEVWEVRGAIGTLDHRIHHAPHKSIDSFLEKLNTYTSIEAEHRKSLGKHFSFLELCLFPSAKFIQNYILRFGFLEGFPGLAMAYMMSIHSLTVRVKMYEITKS